MNIADIEINKELEMAFEFVYNTNRNVYLTGRAGTGKTTFLKKIKEDCPKRMVVVAPTGVAAINAGGVTMHSLFQLPFTYFLPDFAGLPNNPLNAIKYRKHKRNLLKSIELLIIDEISMVRADVFDAIDILLRRLHGNNQPFGGVQVLMIGDVYQLQPVAKEDEWSILKQYYENMFFFSSNVFKRANPVVIELKKIYRQKDFVFISLLEKIRNNGLDAKSLQMLNQRYNPEFDAANYQGYIILTTHNYQSSSINEKRLEELDSPEYNFEAIVDGDFPEYIYPTLKKLSLKEGAQVMFVKNDASPEKRYYNGKIGKIVHVDEDSILVKSDDEIIDVTRVSWSNIRFVLDDKTKEIVEEEIGSFTQYPLKLAWAITIHKSQGLTFDKVIVDAAMAFAHGQVYVALSRCTSIEGIVLSSLIGNRSIITDNKVLDFNREIEEKIPDEADLANSKKQFRNDIIKNIFDFEGYFNVLMNLLKIIKNAGSAVPSDLLPKTEKIFEDFKTEIYSVSLNFHSFLLKNFYDVDSENIDEQIKNRILKACDYFLEKLIPVYDYTSLSDFDSDSAKEEAELKSLASELQKLAKISMTCLEFLRNNFDIHGVLKVRYLTEESFKFVSNKKNAKSFDNIEHIELYYILKAWRDETAENSGLERYRILPNASLEEMANKLPTSIPELAKVKGFGKKKIDYFGNDLVKIIAKYCIDRNLKSIDFPSEPEEIKPAKTKKRPSAEISLEMFREGKSLSRIAAERNLTEDTVAAHLLKYIQSGDVNLLQLMDKQKANHIATSLENYRFVSLKDAKDYFGDDVKYYEIKWVMAAMANFEF
ncbi:MAG: AAA family ATPase [Bacteroidales bacterium]|nr:AAA family ATPase [Bacteroidales bacterium]